MLIEKVHGLQATSMSLNDRFTILASAAPVQNIRQQPRRRPSTGSVYNHNLNARNRLIEQIARSLEWQRKRQELRQRIGQASGRLRRFNSEGSLMGMRSISYGNINHNFQSIKNRLSWRQTNGNNLRSAWGAGGRWWQSRAMRRRAAPRAFRPRGWNGAGGGRGNMAGRGPRGARGGPRGRSSRPGIVRSQTPKPVPSKEELDAQLDQYMAGSKSALDKELEDYMKSAMELDGAAM